MSSLRKTLGEITRSQQQALLLQQAQKDPLHSLTLEDLTHPAASQLTTAENRLLGFALFRQNKSSNGTTTAAAFLMELINLLKTISGFSHEEAMCFWAGASALPDEELIRLGELDTNFFRDLLVSDSCVVRLASVTVLSNILGRMHRWNVLSGAFESWSELEAAQEQRVDRFVNTLLVAIAERTEDEDASVVMAAFECLGNEFAHSPRMFLTSELIHNREFQRRLAFPIKGSIPGTILASRLCVASSNNNIGEEAEFFAMRHLLPQMQYANSVRGGEELELVSAECALYMMQSGRIRTSNAEFVNACCNACIRTARSAVRRKSVAVPPTSKQVRCIRVLLALLDLNLFDFGETLRVITTCTLLGNGGNTSGITRECCERIIRICLAGSGNAFAALFLVQNAPLALSSKVWRTPGERDLFICEFIRLLLATKLTDEQQLVEFGMQVLLGWEDCITWHDGGLRVANAYVDLAAQVLLCKYSSLTALEEEDRSEAKVFVKNAIEWKLESISNLHVRARFAWVLGRAYCLHWAPHAAVMTKTSNNYELGHLLVEALKSLLLQCITPSHTQQQNKPVDKRQEDGAEHTSFYSLLPSGLAIFSHLVLRVPQMRSHVSTLLMYLTTKPLCENHALVLKERRAEIKHLIATNHFIMDEEFILQALASPPARAMRDTFRVEKQLSALHDLLYVHASVERESSSSSGGGRLCCLLRVVNQSSLPTGMFELHCGGRGGISCQEDAAFVASSGLPASSDGGAFLQWKFELQVEEEEAEETAACFQNYALDVGIVGEAFTISLPSWNLPSVLWFTPASRAAAAEAARFSEDWDASTAHSAKCQVQFLSNEMGRWADFFRANCFRAGWNLVHATERTASFRTNAHNSVTTTTRARQHKLLATAQVIADNCLQLEFRCATRQIFPRAGKRADMVSALFENCACTSVTWNEEGAMRGRRAMMGLNMPMESAEQIAQWKLLRGRGVQG